VKRVLIVTLFAFSLGAVPAGGAAIVSPTFRLAIVHVVHGCHVWQTATKELGPAATISVKRGTKLELRISCPMDFDLVQTAGPPLALGGTRLYSGTARTIVFRKRGVYKLRAKNVQSSQQQGLQTLGDDSTLTVKIRVT